MINGHVYTIGVLVNSNHSHLDTMRSLLRNSLPTILAYALETVKARDNQDKAIRPPLPTPRQGSIIIVIATDLPLDSQELRQLAERAGIGIADTGSSMSTNEWRLCAGF